VICHSEPQARNLLFLICHPEAKPRDLLLAYPSLRLRMALTCVGFALPFDAFIT